MKRVTIIASIALFGLGGLALGLALGDRAQPTEPTAAAPVAPAPSEDDPCAEYIAQGIACEFVAFPEMEIKPSGGPEVARR
jgi:hypothetical protein